MDFRTKDADGKTICPNCQRHYLPELPEKDPHDDRVMQAIYPEAEPYQREQLISGLCSDRCWDEYLGSDGSWRKKK